MTGIGRVHAVVLGAALALLGCNAGGLVDEVDAGRAQEADAGPTVGGGADAGALDAGALADAGAVMAEYPTWALVDVQPTSSRFNQTYGLSAFAGRPLVVVLLEGF